MTAGPLDHVDHVERWNEAESAIVGSLRAGGLLVDQLRELSEDEFKPGESTAQLLMGWLEQPMYPPVREELVQILVSPWANRSPGLFDSMKRAYLGLEPAHDTKSLRMSLDAGLGRVARKSDVAALCELVVQPDFGPARVSMIAALGRLGDDSAPVRRVLTACLSDIDVAAPAASALSKLDVREAAPAVLALSEDERYPLSVRRKLAAFAEKLSR